MRFSTVILTILSGISTTTPGFSQSDCKVAMLGIEESYEGGCKKGLADGKGKASGQDSYEGEFKKGRPGGYGEYIWENGDTYKGEWVKGKKDGAGKLILFRDGNPDSVVVGYWANDDYIGLYEYAYKVMSKTPEVLTMQFSNKGEQNQLVLMFTQRRIPIRVNGLSVTNLYGTGIEMNRGVIYHDIKYPYEGEIRFTYIDALASGSSKTINVELTIRINIPGAWEIRMDLRDEE